MKGVDRLVTGRSVITMDPARRVLDDGAVALSGTRIVEVGSRADLRDRHPDVPVLGGEHAVVLPGLIDAHGHAGHALLKPFASDAWAAWPQRVTEFYFRYTDPEFWYHDARLAAAERLRAGVTTGVSVLASRPRSTAPEPAIEHARGAAELGGCDILGIGPTGPPYPFASREYTRGGWQQRSSTLQDTLAVTEEVVRQVHGAHQGLSRVVLTPFTLVQSLHPSRPATAEDAGALQPIDREHGRAVRELSRALGVRIHTDAFGGMVRMAAQDPETALLGPGIHLQHCLGLFPDEVAILAETGTAVSHAPVGRAPLAAMLAAGVTVAVSSDGCAPRRGFDLLDAARSTGTAYQFVENDPQLLPPGKLLEMITIDAARVLGMDDEIGSLEVGKRADLVLIDTDVPHLAPWTQPVHQLMYRASGADVTDVVVAGRPVVADRRLTSADTTELVSAASEHAERALRRAGERPGAGRAGWGEVHRRFF